MLTPLRADLSIDDALFAGHARTLLDTGCGGITIFGTTGEGPSFSTAERQAALEALVHNGIAADRIIVSTSCTALPDTVALTRHAVDLGTHGCLVLPPFFFKGVSDQGIIDGYRQLIAQVADARLRLYLYHIPQVTGIGLSHGVIRTLLDAFPDTIAGIKDSACSTAHSVALAAAFLDRITVYVGFEPDLQTLASLGSPGAISGLANFAPRLVHHLVSDPRGAGAARDMAQTQALIKLLDGFSLMPALKGIMALRSGNPAWLRVRSPLVALTVGEQDALETLYRTVSDTV